MYTKRRTANEQYKLIMECRNSGMSDCAWCKENGINPSTFYNWVQRLRAKGIYDIPDPVSVPTIAEKQDVVKIDIVPDFTAGPLLTRPDSESNIVVRDNREWEHFTPTMEINLANVSIKLSNNTSQQLLSNVMSYLLGGGL